jgi:hypothetical protein
MEQVEIAGLGIQARPHHAQHTIATSVALSKTLLILRELSQGCELLFILFYFPNPPCFSCFDVLSSFSWNRFGPGIYTSATSSKADGYRRNNNTGIVWNALLLNRVVVGHPLDCYTATTYNNAPTGYDSVSRPLCSYLSRQREFLTDFFRSIGPGETWPVALE